MRIEQITAHGNSCDFCSERREQKTITELSGAGIKVRACESCLHTFQQALNQERAAKWNKSK